MSEHRTTSEASEGHQSSRSSSIYPDTEDLLKVALQMSNTRGQITETAENVLVSADGVCFIHIHSFLVLNMFSLCWFIEF